MGGVVVDLLDPGPQPGVEVGQIGNVALVEFAQELVTKRAVPALELALALGRIGPAKDQMNAQACAYALQGGSTVGSAVVDNDFIGAPHGAAVLV